MMSTEAGRPPVPVLLTHGIWMTSLELRWLGSRLAECGFEPSYFRYRSLGATPAENARRLGEHIRGMGLSRLHLVAHSLGGIVLLHLFDQCSDIPPGRVVLLGAPVVRSGVANVVAGYPMLRPILGRSLEQGLLGGAPPWRGDRELGVIAGTRPFGVGSLVGGLEGENDGTVAVAETRLAGAEARCTIHATHTSMLFSRVVARQTCRFLKDGRFDPC